MVFQDDFFLSELDGEMQGYAAPGGTVFNVIVCSYLLRWENNSSAVVTVDSKSDHIS